MILQTFLLTEVIVVTFFTLAFFFKKPFLWTMSIIANFMTLFSINKVFVQNAVVANGEVVSAIAQVNVNTILFFNAVLLICSAVLGILDYYDINTFETARFEGE